MNFQADRFTQFCVLADKFWKGAGAKSARTVIWAVNP